MSDQPQTAESGHQIDGDERTDLPEGDGSGKAPKGNREARYRTERNQARDALLEAQARIETLQTRELERIASKSLSNPADLLTLSGKSLADFLGEGGELDAELITETANEILGSRPGLRHNQRAVDPTQGMGNHTPIKTKPSWGGLIAH